MSSSAGCEQKWTILSQKNSYTQFVGAVMSPSPAKTRSIASQLVFLFTFSAAFLLACGLGVFYWMVVRHSAAEDNAVLADKIAALTAELDQSPERRIRETEFSPA